MSYTFPIPPSEYNASAFSVAFRQIATAIANSYQVGGNIEFQTNKQQLILRSPNGSKFEIKVDDSGNLSTTQIT